MENIDLTQKVASDAMTFLSGAGMVIVSVIIVLLYIFIKRYKARFIPMLVGIVAYIGFIGIGYNLIAGMLTSNPAAESSYGNSLTILKVLVLVIFVGLLTAARIIGAKFILKNYDRPGDILIFGLGTGICDTIICAISTLTLMVWTTGINNTGLEKIFEGVSDSEIIETYNSFSSLFTSPGYFWMLLAFSAVLDLLVSCGIAVIIYGVMTKKLPTYWYALSGVITFFVMLPFKLYDISSTMGIIVPFGIKTLFFVGVVYLVFTLDNRYIGGVIAYSSGKGKGKVDSSSMPKFGIGNFSKK